MLIAILLALQLASGGDFVTFKRCYLDVHSSPPQFHAYDPNKTVIARDLTFSVRRSSVLFVTDPEGGVAGIKCTKIGTMNGNAFVQGTSAEVRRLLTEED
ncbi:MAG: hypothetical protein ACR2RF_32205 [Geminicoccaceae bacterium]